MSTINEAAVLRFYVATQGYSDRITAIEAQAASSLATHKTDVAAAIAQVNLTQSQTITALTLEVSNLKTDLTDSITATQTDLINRADQLAQDVTDITQQLTQDKAAFTQEIQDALDYLKDDASVASALRTPRKINGTDFDGRSDITTNVWGATRTFKVGNKTISINGTSNVEYSLADVGAFPDVGGTLQGSVEVAGNLSVAGTISATLEGTAARADKLQVARKIQGVDFDGTQDISLPTFTAQTDGLVPKRVGATSSRYLREDGTWVVPPDTTYALLTKASAEDGTATSANSISAKVLKDAIQYHAPTVTDIVGNAGTATKLQTPRTINGVSFDGTQNILLPSSGEYSLPTASASELGGIKVGSGLAISNSVLSVGTLNQSTTGNAATASKLQTARTISLTGKVTGSVSFDGSNNASIATAITGLGVANGIATLDSNGHVPSTQLPSYVDDVLEYPNVAAFPSIGETGKIYVETTGNTTYRWSGTAYVKITSGDVSSVAGKTGIVTLSKADVGLVNVDNTADSSKSVASAAKLTTARTINGVSFDGTSNITVADSTKAPLESANLIGTPTAPTAATTTNTTQLATTAFVHAVNTADTGSSATTLKLKTARTIGGVSFNGTANIDLPGVNTIGNQSTTGNAASATKLATPVQINGVNFDGSQSIDIVIPGGGGGGSTSYANTAGKLANPVQIHGVNFDGSVGLTIPTFTATMSGVVPAAGSDTTTYLRSDGTWQVPTYPTITSAEVNTGTDTTGKLVTAALLKQAVTTHTPLVTNIGNATTATKLQTARTIGGVSFDGSANINLPGVNTVGNQSTTGNATTASRLVAARTINGTNFNGTANIITTNWGTTRTLTIGSTAKSVNGSLDVSWSLAEIGAAAILHNHPYLSTSGGTLSGDLKVTGAITAASILSSGNITAFSDARLKDNIITIDDALNKVSKLKGVTYNRIDMDDKDKRYLGLIAQDVQSVMPEAVNINNDEISTLSVDYQGLIGLLVESIKELKLEIDELKEKVK